MSLVTSSAAGVFVLTEASTLVPMQAASFATEDNFQVLLARFPALLAGDQINAASPQRFVLIDREQPIASEPGGGGRWSLDHLFLDQDGVPTLVEVKRGTDTRIRREVVGQMLDYAANAILHWPLEALRARFEGRCQADSRDPTEALHEELGIEPDADAFWSKVKANLQAGRIRMLFVADRIPPELRKVVEFMNLQMRPAEVLAIELRQYEGGGLKTLAPIVFGQTQEAIDEKSGLTAKPRRLWDEQRLLDAIAIAGDPATATAKAIVNWMKAKADRLVFNDAPSVGCVSAEFDFDTERCTPLRLWTDGGVPLSFAELKRTPAFAGLTDRQELLARLSAIPGVAIPAAALESQPTIRLSILAKDQGAKFLAVMEWMVEKLRALPSGHSE